MVIDNRQCDQCGELFAPRREHARFCSARCRMTWNQQNADADQLPAPADTLEWSIAAMWQSIERLRHFSNGHPEDGFAIIGEAVWRVTMVDFTLVRYEADAYTELLDSMTESERDVIEDTFGGLRFVRNRMAYDELSAFVRPARQGLDGAGDGRPKHGKAPARVGSWTWIPVPEPVAPALTERGKQWEMSRYASYQAQLAGRPVGETFDRATDFLSRVFTPSDQQSELRLP